MTMEERIRESLMGSGELNLSYLARQAGIPSSTVSNWKKNGVTGMSLLHFAKWTGARRMTGEEVMRLLSMIRRAV